MGRIYEALKRAELERGPSLNSDHAILIANSMPSFNPSAVSPLATRERVLDFMPPPTHGGVWPADWSRSAGI